MFQILLIPKMKSVWNSMPLKQYSIHICANSIINLWAIYYWKLFNYSHAIIVMDTPINQIDCCLHNVAVTTFRHTHMEEMEDHNFHMQFIWNKLGPKW